MQKDQKCKHHNTAGHVKRSDVVPCLVCHHSCGSQRKTKERKISMKHLDQTLRDEAGEVDELEKRLLQEPFTKLVNYAKG